MKQREVAPNSLPVEINEKIGIKMENKNTKASLYERSYALELFAYLFLIFALIKVITLLS